MQLTIVNGPNQAHQFSNSQVEKIQTAFPDLKIALINETDSDFETKLGETDFLLAFNLKPLSKENTKKLKWIQITSAGVNFLPEFIKDSDIILTNASGVHPIPIAEHIIGFMIILARQMHVSHLTQVEKKTWDRSVDEGNILELSGGTVAIIGLGRIGQHTAHLAKAFGMKVLGVVRNPNRHEENVDELVGQDKLNDVLAKSDFVVNCLPGTEETEHLFDLEKFKKMKPTAYYINIGRGTTTNETDLIKALKEGVIAGAGLDVFEKEPLPDESPLWQMENVIITPHYSGRTPHYMERVIEIFNDNLQAYLDKKPLPTQVDKKLGY